MRLFPGWAKALGLNDVRLVGCDLPLHAERHRYREVIQRLKDDDHAAGGLITSHKIDVFDTCRDLFDGVDRYAELCGEAACLSRREGKLLAFATDPISSARAFDDFVPSGARPDVLCFGGGGSATAITVQLLERRRASRIIVVDRSAERLARIRDVLRRLDPAAHMRYVESADPGGNDRLVAELPAGSLVINATGMGKDLPGSPVTDEAVLPSGGYAWDLNYRGDLDFLGQARRQQGTRRVHVEDGWRYFIHGWAVVVGTAFGIDVDAERTARLAAIAEPERPRAG